MFGFSKPKLLLIVAAVVSALAILLAAWRLMSVQGSLPAPPTVSGSPSGATPSQTDAETQKSDAKSQAGAPSAPAAAASVKPSFDVVRVEPGGESVVAGRAAPGARVALLASGKVIAEADADLDGQFVILPSILPPGSHVLSLSAAGSVSEQTVAVVVPERGQGEVLTAMTAPGQPTRVLAQPGGKVDASKLAAEAPLRIVSVEAQQGGAFFVSGVAEPGAPLRLYLNDSFVASVVGGPDGRWSVRVDRGMSPGAYVVRADQVDASGQTAARVEAPFDYPAEALAEVRVEERTAAQAPNTPAAPPDTAPGTAKDTAQDTPLASSPQNVRVNELRTARVERGDSLWRISRAIYGEGLRYMQIYDANAAQLRNPRRIFPGQVLVVPEGKPASGTTPRTPAR